MKLRWGGVFLFFAACSSGSPKTEELNPRPDAILRSEVANTSLRADEEFTLKWFVAVPPDWFIQSLDVTDYPALESFVTISKTETEKLKFEKWQDQGLDFNRAEIIEYRLLPRRSGELKIPPMKVALKIKKWNPEKKSLGEEESLSIMSDSLHLDIESSHGY